MTRASWLLVFGAVSACVVATDVPPGAQIACATDAECPTGTTCSARGVCVADELLALGPPELIGAPEPLPSLAKAGDTIELAFSVEGYLDGLPVVRLVYPGARLWVEDAERTDTSAGSFVFTYFVDGSEPEGATAVEAVLTDQVGSETTRLAGSVTLDFTPPEITDNQWEVDPLVKTAVRNEVVPFAARAETEATLVLADIVDASGAQLLDVLAAVTLTPDAAGQDLVGTADLTGVDLSAVQSVRVSLEMRDAAGNVNVPSLSLPLSVDLTPPLNTSVEVLGGPITYTQNVMVQVTAAEATAVRFFGDVGTGVDTVWHPFPPTVIEVVLSAGGGDKTVQAEFRDGAGNTVTATAPPVFYSTGPPDLVGPEVLLGTAIDSLTMTIAFNEPVLDGAEDVANYLITDPGMALLAVGSASLSLDRRQVTLTTASQVPEETYTVAVTGVSDLAGNLINLSHNEATVIGWGTVDRSPPNVIGPGPVVQIIRPNAPVDFGTYPVRGYDPTDPSVYDSDAIPELVWTSRLNANEYEVTIATDSGYSSQVAGSPFVVPASSTSFRLSPVSLGGDEAGDLVDPLEARTYYWRVRADVTDAGQYGEGTFDGVDNILYVHCPTGVCDDTGRVGNQSRPFQRLRQALVAAASRGIFRLHVGARDGGAPYVETIALTAPFELYGGFTSTWVWADRVPAANVTAIRSSSGIGLLAAGVIGGGAIDGFTIESSPAEDSVGLLVDGCDSAFEIRNSIVRGAEGVSTSYGTKVVNAGDPTEGPTFVDCQLEGGSTAATPSGASVSAGILVDRSAPTLIRVTATGGAGYQFSHGVRLDDLGPATVTAMDSTIVSGAAVDYSIAIRGLRSGQLVVLDTTTVQGGMPANMESRAVQIGGDLEMDNCVIESGGTLRSYGVAAGRLVSRATDITVTSSIAMGSETVVVDAEEGLIEDGNITTINEADDVTGIQVWASGAPYAPLTVRRTAFDLRADGVLRGFRLRARALELEDVTLALATGSVTGVQVSDYSTNSLTLTRTTFDLTGSSAAKAVDMEGSGSVVVLDSSWALAAPSVIGVNGGSALEVRRSTLEIDASSEGTGVYVGVADPVTIVNNVIDVSGGGSAPPGQPGAAGVYLDGDNGAVITNNTIAVVDPLSAVGVRQETDCSVCAAIANNVMAIDGFNARRALQTYSAFDYFRVRAYQNNAFWNVSGNPTGFYTVYGSALLNYQDLSFEGSLPMPYPPDLAMGNVLLSPGNGGNPFVDRSGGDFHLTTGAPLNARCGGRDAGSATCGVYTETCGDVLVDREGTSRTLGATVGEDIGTNAGAAGYSVGAYEQD